MSPGESVDRLTRAKRRVAALEALLDRAGALAPGERLWAQAGAVAAALRWHEHRVALLARAPRPGLERLCAAVLRDLRCPRSRSKVYEFLVEHSRASGAGAGPDSGSPYPLEPVS